MGNITTSKKLIPPLDGMPDISIIQLPTPKTIALSAMDIPYIRPKLLVKENEPVKIGTPLFCDKRNSSIQYVSPGAGTIKRIVFGERRRLKEVVITLDQTEEYLEFDPIGLKNIQKAPKEDIIAMLQKGGLWQGLREFPSKDTADHTRTPTMIIVSLNGNDPFSPHPGIVLEKKSDLFKSGLKFLKRFSPNIIVTAREDSLQRLEKIKHDISHIVANTYPAWDPGVVLYQLKTRVEDNRAWCISAEHLVLIAKFIETGQYPTDRVVTVTRTPDRKPHIITRQGAPVADIIGNMAENTLITTGHFNGHLVDPESHLGFFETTLNVIHDQPEEEMFGFIRPGLEKPTASKTFLSCLLPTPKKLDCNLHGEERACINCGYCTRICPVSLAPNFIMKALLSDDIEDALSFGLWDCTRCGLCSYCCPSKIELTQILSKGMDEYYKDKQ